MRSELWYKNAIIYAVDVSVFADSDGDGVGDLRGVIERLDYIADLGVTCLWLLPFYPSPRRDNGYDIAGYMGVDGALGTLDDFIELVQKSGERGIRVLIDLVMNHTSDTHPWFQAARRAPDSRYRGYYVWTDAPPPTPPGEGSIFPGQENGVWTFDEVAGLYYYHKFYHFQPDLNLSNPEVRDEIHRVLEFWLSFGISGFRVDAAPHMIAKNGIPGTKPTDPHGVLRGMNELVRSRRSDAVLLGESDVEPEKLAVYYGDGDELNMLFNFVLDNYLFLALAREEAEPLCMALRRMPTVPESGGWANFLRNLDELDLERLDDDQRAAVFEAFAPHEQMRIFGRGIRRRLAPMLGGDRKRLELAWSLLFSMPGAPTFIYGDELGMGEDLELEGRDAVRTPMQWSARRNAGFSGAPKKELARPVIESGAFSYKNVNVAAQQDDEDSLLRWMQRLIRARRSCPEFGLGSWYTIAFDDPAVFAQVIEWKGNPVVTVHNLGADRAEIVLDLADEHAAGLEPVFGDGSCEALGGCRFRLELEGYDYRWYRVALGGDGGR